MNIGNADFQEEAEEKKQQKLLRRNSKRSRFKTERYHKADRME